MNSAILSAGLCNVLAASMLLAAGCPGEPEEPIRYLDPVFTEVQTATDIQYGEAIPQYETEPAPLILDLVEPSGDSANDRAAVVWIHGGGFTSGTRKHNALVEFSIDLAKRGYVCVSIDYRLQDPDNFDGLTAITEAVHDAKAAVRWLRANAETLRIDPDRIAVGGGSAGAYTALELAYSDDLGEGESGNPGYSSDVLAVVDFWGALDQDRDAAMDPDEAPVLIFHGTEDATVAFSEAEELVERAEAIGLPYEFYPLEGEGHSAWDNSELFLETMPPFLYDHVIE